MSAFISNALIFNYSPRGGGIRTIGKTVKKPTDPTKNERNPKRTYNEDQDINKIIHAQYTHQLPKSFGTIRDQSDSPVVSILRRISRISPSS